MSNVYESMTREEFNEILEEIVGNMSAAAILACGDAYAALSEYLNNDVLETWEERQS